MTVVGFRLGMPPPAENPAEDRPGPSGAWVVRDRAEPGAGPAAGGIEPGRAAGATGRRERKKLATRLALETAALRLFTEQGYERTTIEDITESADVSLRTFFRYFGSKRDVLFGDLTDRADQVQQALAARPPDEPPLEALRQALRLALRGAASSAEQHPAVDDHATADDPSADDHASAEANLLRRVLVLEREPQLAGHAQELFADLERVVADDVARRTGLDPERDLYPRLVASAILGALGASVLTWARRGGVGHPAEIVEDALELLSAGLPPPARRSPGHLGPDPGQR